MRVGAPGAMRRGIAAMAAADAPQVAVPGPAVRPGVAEGAVRDVGEQILAAAAIGRAGAVCAAIRVVCNGVREGLCQGSSRALVIGALFACPELSPLVLILCSAVFLIGAQAFAVLGTPVHSERSSSTLTCLKGLSLVFPAATVVGELGSRWFADVNPEVADRLLAMQLSMAFNQMSRIFREALQTGTRSWLTAPVNLVHADGSGLNAEEQRTVNVWRDLGYTATSEFFFVGGPSLVGSLLADLPIPPALRDSMVQALLVGLNDMCEGWADSLARFGCRFAWGDEYMLQHGIQNNPGMNVSPFLNHAASRLVTGPIIDIFMQSALVADQLGASPATVSALRATGALANGLLGGLRGRLVELAAASEPIDVDGTKEPDGLLNLMVSASRSLACGVRHALPDASDCAQFGEVVMRIVQPEPGREPGREPDRIDEAFPAAGFEPRVSLHVLP
jgi:hypothetical protein